MNSFDPIELAVFKSATQSVAEEMGAVLRRTAFSPNIKERRDYSCAVFDSSGQAIAMGAHMPFHLGSMPMSVHQALAMGVSSSWRPLAAARAAGASVIPARFGRSSFAKHRWAARRKGLKLVEARGPGLERDLDRPADLATLVASGHRGRARTACLEMGLAARLLERPVGA